MEKEEIKELFFSFIEDLEFSSYETSYWERTTPWIVMERDFVCSDEEKVELSLVVDGIFESNKTGVFFRVGKDNMYFEYLLYKREGKQLEDCEVPYNTDAVRNRAYKFLSDLWQGGKEYVDKNILYEGITRCDTLLVTEQRMDSVVKLSSFCTLGIYGELFHGVSELESYCCSQMASSSPYLLKRSMIVWDANFDIRRKCINYLICKNQSEAIRVSKTFIGIDFITAMALDYDYYNDKAPYPKIINWFPRDFPPMVCTASGLRHLLMVYIEGTD